MADRWTAPVLEELSIPAGTMTSADDAGSDSPDTVDTGLGDPGTTAS